MQWLWHKGADNDYNIYTFNFPMAFTERAYIYIGDRPYTEARFSSEISSVWCVLLPGKAVYSSINTVSFKTSGHSIKYSWVVGV